MDIVLVSILALCGVALFVVEIFLIPGIGFAVIAGVLCMAASVFCAYYYIGALAGHITLAALLLLSAVAVWLFLRSRMLDKMALKTDINSKVDLLTSLDIKVGDKGVTTSRLAPMGRASIEGKEVEAKSMGAFIDPGEDVEVLRVEGNTVIVRPAAPVRG